MRRRDAALRPADGLPPLPERVQGTFSNRGMLDTVLRPEYSFCHEPKDYMPPANRRWRCPFRCRGSRRESAVAQFFSLGGEHRVGEMRAASNKQQTPTWRKEKMKKAIALSIITLGILGAVNIAKACSGGCNYGTPSNPNWVYISWDCPSGTDCSLNCVNNPPTGSCVTRG
jgi:hypothetical protein